MESLYSAVNDSKTRQDSELLQNALRGLFSFRIPNILWNSAVITVLRLCLLQHPDDPANDMVIDYSFQYVRTVKPVPPTHINKADGTRRRAG